MSGRYDRRKLKHSLNVPIAHFIGFFGCRWTTESREGKNPLDGWVPSVPTGEAYTLGSKEFIKTEKDGIKELGNVGFVLVAGGLGERLGYSDIKVSIDRNVTTRVLVFLSCLWCAQRIFVCC